MLKTTKALSIKQMVVCVPYLIGMRTRTRTQTNKVGACRATINTILTSYINIIPYLFKFVKRFWN